MEVVLQKLLSLLLICPVTVVLSWRPQPVRWPRMMDMLMSKPMATRRTTCASTQP